MWKLRIGVFVTSGLLALATTSAAWGASGGDPNAGDVWVDNVGQPAGPGHEMDPHLACQDIALYGAGLADSSGSFTVDGWPPSGSKTVDYSGGQWQVQPGTQQIAVIPIAKLMSGAQASGDTAAHQGFHFKLDFSQDPQKHKTFWVDCTPSSGGGSNSGGGGGNTSGGGGSTTPTTTTTPATTTTPIKTSIGAVNTTRHKTHKRRRKLRHPARHRKIHRRHVKAIRLVIPEFTG